MTAPDSDDFVRKIGDMLVEVYGAAFDHAVMCGSDVAEWEQCSRAPEHQLIGNETRDIVNRETGRA